MTKWKCMYCGRWHKDPSKILSKHVHLYYKQGGTFPLSTWETKD
ncbi:MAG: hypothetical protein ACW98X_17840 [Promethearchaeota archaeon]|jgi:hypothetical protein